jgi:predicted component of type VI protein secretion system
MDAPILRFDPHHRFHRENPPPAVSLEITRGRVRQRTRNVAGAVFLIGASPDCDLVLGDPQFPDSYAYLFVKAGKATIRWLGAGPELCVSDEVVETAELADGDTVAFGPFELRVSIRRSPDESRQPADCLPFFHG